MNIPSNPSDPSAFGLPNEAELAALASRFFPEYGEGEQISSASGYSIYDEKAARSTSPFVKTGGYSPIVEAYDGEVRRCGGESARYQGAAGLVGARSLE